MATESAVIRIENLSKTFALGFFRKKVRAVVDVSFEVGSGEIFGLLGPNGAGKTTSLKILLGLLRSDGGRVEMLGAPAGNVAAKQRLGYLPESPYFYEYLTGRELLLFTAQLFSIDRRAAKQRAAELIDRVGLKEAGDRPLRRYSKGMLQRIGLAQALINDPDLVILDEPLTGLDPLGRKHVREVIAELREAKKTVVFSSHILSDVELLADRVAILVRGKTVEQGRLDQLIDAKVMSTEVVAHNVGEDLRRALTNDHHRVKMIGDKVMIVVAGVHPIDSVLARVRDQGGTISAVTPRKESLEDVVVRRALAAETDTAEMRAADA